MANKTTPSKSQQTRREHQTRALDKDRQDREAALTKKAEDRVKAAEGEDPFEGEEQSEVGGETGEKREFRPLKDAKPGDIIVPRSNPGAAARIPAKPLQPESMQSHGEGIIHDKDTVNPPYNVENAEEVDEGPSGSGSAENLPAETEEEKEARLEGEGSDPGEKP
jgi:hypothetical protein